MANQKKKGIDMQLVTVVTVLLVVLGFGLYALVSNLLENSTEAGSEKQAKEQVSELTKDQPAIGKADAPVKLVEFGDFKCPSCKRFHDEIYPQLKKDFIDTGKVQLHFVNMAFLGPDSITGAMAGEAIYKQNPEAFWKFYDAVYSNQGPESEAWITPERIAELVKKHVPGVDANKVVQDVKNNTYKRSVDTDNLLAQTHQVDSVPTVFVNGKKLDSALKYDELKKAIEEALNKK
ncbi:DsbA family protein [Thermoflavimicrobium dichotomicum]|uniref:Protein-disulfide isomerase n=1 Tax=Thermoflavimicrobium dichotomicum TaxID=46223 RepID=A0A1I3L861_9BACL|nr:DsbA family protein [Thermoflavimicrobium dichotomicum]SFI80887.1 Protein-disulfide isomerase [Thermoflavimicrobium dichotomicum]